MSSPRDDIRTAWWKSQPQPVRALRMITDYWTRQQAAEQLGLTQDKDEIIWRIVVWDWTPDFVLGLYGQSVNPADYKTDPSLIMKSQPFSLPNHQADPNNRNAIGTTFNPSGVFEVGAEYMDANGQYECLMSVVRDYDLAHALSDPRVTTLPGFVQWWYRVA